MPRDDDKLKKLALILDTCPEVVASESVDEVREDLIAMGIDPRSAEATVRSAVQEWVRATTSIARRRLINVKAVCPAVAVPGRFKQEKTALVVPPFHMVAQSDRLRELGVEPIVRIAVELRAGIHELVCTLSPLKRPGSLRITKLPKAGKAEIHVARGGGKLPLKVTLGPGLVRRLPLPFDYTRGEESAWRAKVEVHVARSTGIDIIGRANGEEAEADESDGESR